MEANAVRVGDKMRISTALLQQISDTDDQRSALCRVERIDREDDGCLLILLTRIREPYVAPGNGEVH